MFFLVHIDVEEYVEYEGKKKILFLRTIRETRVVTLAEVHAMYDEHFAVTQGDVQSGHEALIRHLHITGLLRMLVVDDGQSDMRPPLVCVLPVELPTTMLAELPAMSDADCLLRLQKKITDWEEWKVRARQRELNAWYAKHERACIYAAIHAIDLNNNPDRIESHVLMVMLDTRMQVLSEIQQHITVTFTVQNAYSIPEEKVDAQFLPALHQLVPVDGERTVRILICGKHASDHGGWFVCHAVHFNAGPFVASWPPYQPEWLSIFQRRAMVDDGVSSTLPV